jgi:hypothetical protein
MYLLASSLAAALLDGLSEQPIDNSASSAVIPFVNEPLADH